MTEKIIDTNNRERVFVPCQCKDCLNTTAYMVGDTYRRRYCNFHYRQVHNELITRGASAEEMRKALLEDLV